MDGELVERPLADGNENYFDQFVKDIQGEDVALNADAVIHSMRTVLKIQQAADEGLREVKL